MENLKKMLPLLFVLVLLFSCNKDDDNPGGFLDIKKISAKWNVAEEGDFISFEFNESGNYIVVKGPSASGQVIFGVFEIIDGETIVLNGYGTIKVISLSSGSMSFTITEQGNPGLAVDLNATKAAEFGSTSKTDMLCRTWKLISINGENVEGTSDALTVLFSKAGTYLVTWNNGESGLASWKWSDATETKFLYSWDEVPIWAEADDVEVVELTTNVLKILERFGDYESDLYYLEPVVNTKSAITNTLPVAIKPQGFIKR